MLKWMHWAVLLLVVYGGCTPHTAPPAVSPPDEADPIAQFEARLEALRRKLGIPGMSVAVLRNQAMVYRGGLGYADLENEIPATAHTPYNIASLTKTFAAAVLMRLVEDGRLRLDDELAVRLADTSFEYSGYHARGYADLCTKIRKLAWRYGPVLWDFRCHREAIRVRHLLTHTSQGLPGGHYRYNGFLFSLLTDVAEEASGMAFADLVVAEIVAPLLMTDTVPSMNAYLRRRVLARRARYYRHNFWGRSVPSSRKPLRLTASAGIVSTVVDLAKFDAAMDRDAILSPTSRASMHSPTVGVHGRTMPYGLGWFVQDCRGTKLVWHYGHVPDAYSALIVKVPAKALTMILLANSDGASRGFQLGRGDVRKSPFARLFLSHFAGMAEMAP